MERLTTIEGPSLELTGTTKKEIGVVLELGARTAQKRLQHIYQKMSVENETGITARVYEIASIGRS